MAEGSDGAALPGTPKAVTPPPGHESGSIVGRSGELATLRGFFDEVGSGLGKAALIEGEAGIGKTRLLEEAFDYAGQRGFYTLRGVADQLERDQPFGAISEALGPVLRSPDIDGAQLARLLRGEAPAGGNLPTLMGAPDVGFRIVESIVTVLEGLASHGPVALALEDLHWADPSTLRAVQSIGRRIAHLRVALLVTLRPVRRSAELDSVIEGLLAGGAACIALSSVNDDAVRTLTEQVAGGPPGPQLLAQVSGTRGNPLFVIELVKALRDEGAINLADGLAEIGEVSLPPTLRLTILRRISFLSEEALEILPIAAVLGTSFSPAHLARISGRSVVQLLGPLNDAIRAGVLEDANERLAFRHELMRAAIYEDLPLSVRKSLHREVAGALAAAGAGAAVVAEHLFLGGSPGDTEAVRWLRDAAHDVAPRSARMAVELLERALELAERASSQRQLLVAELAPLLVQVGRSDQAAALAGEVLRAGPEPSVEAALHRALGEVLWARGQLAAAVAELEAAGAVAGAPEAGRVAPRALAAHLLVFLGDVDAAREQALEATAEGERLHDDVAVCLGLQTSSIAADAQGRVEEAVELATRAVEVARRSTHAQVSYLYPNLYLGLVLLDADRLSDAEATLQSGLLLAEERGAVLWLPLYHWALAFKRCVTGDWDDAAAEIEGALALVEEVGTRVHAPFLHGAAAWLAVHRGDFEAAEASLEEARQEFMAAAEESWVSSALENVVEAGPHWPVEWGMWVGGLLAEARLDLDEAFAALDVAWTLAEPLRYYLGYRWFGPDLVRVALATDNRERAAAVTEGVEEGARRSSTETAYGAALRCRGMLDDAPDLLLAAIAAYRRGGRVVDAAFTSEEAADALVRAGRGEEAVRLLEEALRVYERIGASRAAAKTMASLRGLGAPVPRRGRAQDRPTVGWGSLTDTERRVVALAAKGLTNRQIGEQLFVSRRTVETHVSHVFQKVGLSSRAQLAAEVARRGGW